MRLKEAREAVGLTQVQVAEKLGIRQSAVSAWENGINYPRIERLLELTQLYHCTIDELLKK